MLLLFGGPPVAAGLDVSLVVRGLFPSLHARGADDLGFWTEAELYRYADEAAKRLARLTGGFVERDATTALAADTAVYSLPARHISTIHVSHGVYSMMPTNVQELEALDSDWLNRNWDLVKRWLQDMEGTAQLRVWPEPNEDAVGNLAFVFHRYPSSVSVAAPVIAYAPQVLREYFTFVVMADARAKEGKAAMPEVAEWARGMADLCVQAAQSYWGEAQ